MCTERRDPMQHSQLTVTFTKALLSSSSFALLMVAIACFGDGRRASVATAVSPAKVAETLDALIQPRFQVDAGVFGNSRIGVPGHDMVLDKEVTTNRGKNKKSQSCLHRGLFSLCRQAGKVQTQRGS